jgi:mitotic spindle assembly checkpoint protein MAD1
MNARGNSQQIVPYDDPLDLLQLSDGDNDGSDTMLCTYQCRQMVKSEVLETLTIREKEVTELQSRVKSLQEANSNQELQKKELEARIQVMEQELAAANGREKSIGESFKKRSISFKNGFRHRLSVVVSWR